MVINFDLHEIPNRLQLTQKIPSGLNTISTGYFANESLQESNLQKLDHKDNFSAAEIS